MKFSTSLVMALAPLAMARRVRNSYPANPVRRAPEMELADRERALLHGMRGAGLTFETRNNHGDNNDDNGDDNSKHDNNDGGNNGINVNVNSQTEIIIIWANPGGGAATTTVNEKVTVTQTVTAGGAATEVAGGATHTVTVGGPAGLVFTPDQLNDVPIGDTVIFEFLQQNHTVTQSGFDAPCVAMAEGMDSGFMPNPNNTVSPPPQVAMQVMADTPLWFYCKQGDHCGSGMTFSVNPTADKTQAQFQQAAIAQNGTGTETPITGGEETASTSVAAATETATEAATEVATATSVATDSAQATDGVSPGSGTVGADGSCSCFVSCSAGSFPAVDSQGIGARGGVAGSLPMNMVGIS